MPPEAAAGSGATAAFFDVDHTLLTVQDGFTCRRFAGCDASEASRHAHRWFRHRHAQGELFDARVLSALRGHARAGALVVLVSEAVPSWLEPIAECVGADLVLCSRPEIRSGRHTGDLAVALTGRRKAEAVRATATTRGLALAGCHAYGSRISDLPMLQSVGNPLVVSDDRSLIRHAARLGWSRWPGTPAHPHTTLGELSIREMQVLQLLAEGCSNLAVSRRLCLSPKTVEAHVRSLFTKLGLAQHPDEHRRVMAVLAYLGVRPDVVRHPDPTDFHPVHPSM
ncbi:haloacid dehalogenase-like hydrolase [Streptomyces sp. NBC_00893]|uniref:haloacid dehalogenase-like hydrolase n=1 Tax=Streptomyces sp. NBC_00893 TaxID=2975862 RepID=UPI00224DD7A2|nr:haloacid dehalogenase-like hydrolase [Streptomyces sp. NBC_00893]MCX4844621.1 haloacid dehalogenase-like hydrolase [Streptomyces sp. NBC_00893]